MARYIVRLHDCYFEYSTVVDAPVTFGVSREEFEEYYRKEYGNSSMHELAQRLERVDAKGTSAHLDSDAADTLCLNRAGPDECELTPDEIYRAYCLMQPVRGHKWGHNGSHYMRWVALEAAE